MLLVCSRRRSATRPNRADRGGGKGNPATRPDLADTQRSCTRFFQARTAPKAAPKAARATNIRSWSSRQDGQINKSREPTVELPQCLHQRATDQQSQLVLSISNVSSDDAPASAILSIFENLTLGVIEKTTPPRAVFRVNTNQRSRQRKSDTGGCEVAADGTVSPGAEVAAMQQEMLEEITELFGGSPCVEAKIAQQKLINEIAQLQGQGLLHGMLRSSSQEEGGGGGKE
jgi:hypothetical protein